LSVSEIALIRSKVLAPSSAGLLHRPRVCRAIEQGLERKLTIVSAPAGYGKTSVLADFAQHSPVPVCWYTADERDRDLGVFIGYLVGAIGEQFPGFGARTQSALASQSGNLIHDPTSVVGELVNEILEIDTSLVIVVDNYETVDSAIGIRTFMHRLLQVLPFNCHLMMSSRVLPDVPITRLTAKHQLAGLTARNLRFTPQEIQELLQSSQIEASDAQAEALAVNSEGWITGVLLLSDLLRDQATATLLSAKRATSETYSFLATEVLDRQPPDIQHFLRTSAVLRQMSSRLCRHVLRIKEPRALLAEIERRNLFVTRFGREGAATYRYHNLFRDFLQEQLRQRDPDGYTELHRRAGSRFEQENDVEEAVYHYLAADEYSSATALMERVAMEWLTRGRVETLLHWAARLPEGIRSQAPKTSLYQSKALTDRYDYKGARQALTHAEAGFTAEQDTICLARVHNQRAMLGLFEGRYRDVIQQAQTALNMLNPDDLAERAQAQRLIGRAYTRLGRLAEGITKLQQALTLYRQIGSLYNVVNLLQDLVDPLTAQGRFDEVEDCLNEALIVSRRLEAPMQLAGVLNELGWLHYLRGQYRDALALYEEGLGAARRGADLRLQAYISVGMADLYRDMEAYERADPLYNAGWQIAQENEPGLAVYILTAQADMHRWRGDHTRALALVRQAHKLAEEKELSFEKQGPLFIAEGVTLAESGEVEGGLGLLLDGIHFLEQRQAKRELVRAYLLLAKVHFFIGDRPQAIAQLRQAVGWADGMGPDQLVVVEGQHAKPLLEAGAAAGLGACRTIIARVEDLKRWRAQLVPTRVETTKDTVSRLEIYALGEGKVVRDERTISSSEWQAAMVKELFFYILIHGPLERDAIGAVFWPELPTKRMADSFHTTIYRMRRALGAAAVVREDSQYRLGEIDHWFDVEEFESLVERARLLPTREWQTENLWRRALALYQGDFLPEMQRVWCVPKREALREMYLEALVGMGQCHESRKEFEGAISWYRQALEVDELREDIQRHIMRCYVEAGRRSEALAQYHHYQDILRRELNIEPSTETDQLYRRIIGERPE
jgi:LuxR family maltose regulon positive regulatory protein